MKRLGGWAFDATRNVVDIASIVTEGILDWIGDTADKIGEHVDRAMDWWEDDEAEQD